AFRARFRHTPLWRPKRRGILRNAAIVLGNRPTSAALPALIRGLNDVEPLVRGAAAWALGRFTETAASEALKARRSIEQVEAVRLEITAAWRAGVARQAASLAESSACPRNSANYVSVRLRSTFPSCRRRSPATATCRCGYWRAGTVRHTRSAK